jgi:hypothetical protein
MNCDLCERQHVHSKKSQLCEGCAEMIQRLVVVKQRMDSQEPCMATAAAAGASSQVHIVPSLRG